MIKCVDFEEKLVLYHEIIAKMSSFEKMNWEDNFRIEFTHDSTAIEGNTLTLIETKMILEDGITPKEIKLKELDEIRGHADAWDFVKEKVAENCILSESILKDIHERILPVRGIGGIYRTVAVYIKGARHTPPSPYKVREAMKDFFYELNHRTFNNTLEKAAWIHAEFVKIHPFQDGNGRTARLLMNYQLMLDGLFPTSVKKADRERYFSVLEEYAVAGNIVPFVQLLQENMEKELNLFLSMYSYHLQIKSLSR